MTYIYIIITYCYMLLYAIILVSLLVIIKLSMMGPISVGLLEDPVNKKGEKNSRILFEIESM